MSVYETATTDLARALGVAEAQRRRGGGVGLCVRVVSAAVLIVIAVSATLLSWEPLNNVFADYQDSPLGVDPLFRPLVAGHRVHRRRRRVLYSGRRR